MNIYVYDPTIADEQSKVRGIGRYLQVLKENLPENTIFTSDLNKIPFESTFINPFINLIQPPKITRRVAKKQIGMIHDVIPLVFPEHFPIGVRGNFNVWNNKRALKTYDIILTNSQSSKKNIINKLGITAEKIQVIYPSLPQAFMTPSTKDGVNKITANPYFIYVGDMTWNKNLVNLAKAVVLADVTCILVGKKFVELRNSAVHDLENIWLQEAREFLSLTKDDKHFIFPGFVPDIDLVALYKNAVANVLVSREEGFGFSYFEAGTQKTPSILADIEIFHETAKDTALYVDPNSPQKLADAMKKISEDKNLRKNLGQKAFEHSALLLESTDQWKDLLK